MDEHVSGVHRCSVRPFVFSARGGETQERGMAKWQSSHHVDERWELRGPGERKKMGGTSGRRVCVVVGIDRLRVQLSGNDDQFVFLRSVSRGCITFSSDDVLCFRIKSICMGVDRGVSCAALLER